MSSLLQESGVAVVLAGAGARGAYEAGVCSVVLPALEMHKQRPSIFLGTSAGSINAVGLASLSHLDASTATAEVLKLWRGIQFRDVFRSPLSAGLVSLATWPARAGRPRRRPGALLDTAPLAATLARLVDWTRLHDNLEMGYIQAVGVVATACSTGRSSVFVARPRGVSLPDADTGRRIDYVRATLQARHVLASSAIPVIFPAVEIEDPEEIRDWYVDGGVRLNTPLKPALALEASQIVVVAASPAASPAHPAPGARAPTPGVAAEATQLLRAVLVDRMVEDLYTLARRNDKVAHHGQPADGERDRQSGDRVIPWLFAGPAATATDHLGSLVVEVLSAPGRPRWQKLAARLLEHDAGRAELLSYLFFDPGFIDQAIRLGQRDGRKALDADGRPIWQTEATQAYSATG